VHEGAGVGHAPVVHAMVVELGFVQQVFVGNALMHSYALAGSLGNLGLAFLTILVSCSFIMSVT
jgi:hypothetical protein